MFKKIWIEAKEFIVEEYKFLITLAVLYIVCTWPVNYYIIIGGGISDVGERIEVSEAYKSKGSFNISYVSELKGTVITYLLSYVIPSWELEDMGNYKYSESENYEDIEFRGDVELQTANSSATKVAYDLAGKEYKEVSSKIYVVGVFDEYDTKFMVQDELLSVDGNTFKEINEYSTYIQKFNEKDTIKVKVLRKGKEVEFDCPLYVEKDRVLFGIILSVVREYDTNPKIEIKFNKSESGPSGGLITTLEIYNQLTKSDLTNSLKIAGTGTVDGEGYVGSIGGVRYKLIGAEAGGADVFLVPKGKNYDECVKVKKEKKLDIKVIGVSTVEEAISELNKLKKK